jgi:hypothetical protein
MPTINDLIDTLCNDRPDELPGTSRYDISDLERTDGDGYRLFPVHLASPQAQLRQLLTNMAIRVINGWDGPRVATAATRAFVGGETHSNLCEEYGLTREQLYAFPLMAQTFPKYLFQEISGVQPIDRTDGKVFFLDGMKSEGGEGSPNLMVQAVCSKAVCANAKTLMASWSTDYSEGGFEILMTALQCVSRELVLEQNYRLLRDLVQAAQQLQGDSVGSGQVGKWSDVDNLLCSRIFTHRRGDATHLFLGKDAATSWIQENRPSVAEPTSEPYQQEGLTLLHDNWGPGLKVYSVGFWTAVRGRTVLALRRGTHWCDAPSVWAPHLFTVGTVDAGRLAKYTEGHPAKADGNGFTFHDKHVVVNPHSLAVMELE